MQNKYYSRRGVYYDLDKSPYCYVDKHGNIFKFSSLKKQSIFERKVKQKEDLYFKEAHKLSELGYNLEKPYFNNLLDIPQKVYNEMQYK